MRPTLALRAFRPTPRMMSPPPPTGAHSHTLMSRLRKVKDMPAELIPLGVVVFFAVGAATYALGRKIMTDKSLRLSRQGPRKEEHH